jgi:ComF family protein
MKTAVDERPVPIPSIVRGLLDLIAPCECAGCDLTLPAGETGFCEACRPLLDRGRRGPSSLAAYTYGGPMAVAIRRLKYSGRTELAAPLGALLADRAVEIAHEVDLVVPVPLHPARLRERGFNQASLLAGSVARALSLPLGTATLARIRDTPPQVRLPPAERTKNVRAAFASKPALDRRVLLIDDVRTTGATLAECSEALRKKGAARVFSLVLAGAEP